MLNFDLSELERIFLRVVTKVVTKTDIDKKAYVVNAGQRKVLEEAGFHPGTYPTNVTSVPLNILGTHRVINASYYGSQRMGSGRSPEYRMGRFIDQLSIGHNIAFATDGRDIFICRVSDFGKGVADIIGAYEDTAVSVNEGLTREELLTRVKQVKPHPDSRTAETRTYYRAPAIIAFAHRRSAYKCEMPGCKYEGFNKYGGGRFIETHHIKPLSKEGEDSIENVAALCPNCHRRMHHAHDKKHLAKILRKAVQRANEIFGIE